MRRVTVLSLVCVAASTLACGSDDAVTPPPPATLVVAPQLDTLRALQATRVFQAVLTNAPGASVRWTSSSPGVATIDDGGLATAVSNGTTIITASAAGLTETALLTVAQEAESLELTPTTLTAWVGESVTVEWQGQDANGFAIEPARARLSSSNPAVATVSQDGRVQAVRDGQTSLGVTVGQRSGYATLTVSGHGIRPSQWAWSDFRRSTLEDVWGSGPDDVWFVGWQGTLLHFGGSELRDVTPGITDKALLAIWGSSATDVWAVGADGVILHYDGSAWSLQSSPETRDLVAIWGSGPSDIWVANDIGIGLHYDGSTWETVDTPYWPFIGGIWGSAPDDVWAVRSLRGEILHYDGTGWTEYLQVPGVNLNDVWGTGPSDVYAVGSQGVVLHYDGVEWRRAAEGVTTRTLASVWASGPDDVWASYGTEVLHFDGSRWTTAWTGAPSGRLWGSSSSDVWIATSAAAAWHFDGQAWTDRTPGVSKTIVTDLWGADLQTVWASDHEGLLAYDGSSWSREALPAEVDGVLGVWGTGPTDVWAAGPTGIAHSDGSAWTLSFAGAGSAQPYRVWGSAPDDVWAVGSGGTVLHFDGGSWTEGAPPELSGAEVTLWDVWGVGPDQAWLVGDDGQVWAWNGALWSRVAEGLSTERLFAVWGSGPADVWVVGASYTALHWNGELWQDRSSELPAITGGVRSSPPLWDLWGSAPDNVWLLGSGGAILHYDGASWTEILEPPTADALYSIWGTAATPIHVGTQYGGLIVGRN